MNKKLLLYILALLFVPFCVYAATDVEIKKVELVDYTDDVELENATFDGLTINFNLKFREVNDFAKYKVTIANVGNKKYTLENETVLSDGDFIKYDYSYENDVKELGVGKEVILYITATYNKALDEDLFVNGVYEEKGKVSINVVGETVKVENPKTNGGYIFGIAIICAVSFLLLAIAYKTHSKIVYSLLLMALLIPLIVFAIEKLTIEVIANVEIEQPAPLPKMTIVDYDAYVNDPDHGEFWIERDFSILSAYSTEYNFVSGMTWGEWLESDYNSGVTFESGMTACSRTKRFLVEYSEYNELKEFLGQENTDPITEDSIYFVGTGISCK